jgi:hypothetical protein
MLVVISFDAATDWMTRTSRKAIIGSSDFSRVRGPGLS